MISTTCNLVFEKCIYDYHLTDDVDVTISNPYPINDIANLLYAKNWVDTVQWHYEDIIRDPAINPVEALILKRKIDASNQVRTDMVEYIDSYFLHQYKEVKSKSSARINTESPAWAIDRLSILALKIYHMQAEVNRSNVSEAHIAACKVKLNILLAQRVDLSKAIDELIEDIANGDKIMTVYKQMKMYNDPVLNPILYNLQIK